MSTMMLFQTVTVALNMQINMLLPSICWVESRHKSVINRNDGNSHSYGMCQVKLETANWMKEYYRIPGKPLIAKDIIKPEVNLLYAGLYLNYQYKVYKGDVICTISAYNAGTCIKGNKKYVKKVLNKLNEYTQKSKVGVKRMDV